jgi:hypothetical protein
MLTQHSSSNNLNNPSSLSAKNTAAAVAATEAEVNRNGPYFDVPASKNVRITLVCESFYGRMI